MMKLNKTALKNNMGMLLCPIITFYLLEFYTHNPFTTMKFPIQLLNIAFFEIFLFLLFFLFGNLRAALLTESIFFALAGLINYFVLQFRSAPIMPWDIFSLKTAVSVAGNYNYYLTLSALLTVFGFLLLFFAEWHCRKNLSRKPAKRILGIASFVLLLWGFVFVLHQDSTVRIFKIYDKLFTPAVMSKRDGTALAFLLELKYMSVNKPDGYRADDAQDLLVSYQKDAEPSVSEQTPPHIIVIMDEAFSDLNILGNFNTNKDYIPFVRSLMNGAEDTISGYLNVSILGGNTPNTEFEYLTGNSLAFLPQGSIPFQQYLNHPPTSLPSHLRELGYQTIAMHPYYSTGWERNTVYPLLGFDTSYFIDDFKDADFVRKYVSDQSNFDKIIEQYENKEPGKPLFLFNVTMQNHSSYTEEFDNFTPDITVEGTTSKALPNYLSLLKLTDDAIADLLSYFEDVSENTIVVFFGDHQPTDSVVEPIWKLQGKSGAALTDEEEFLRYKIPYFIWANYDIEEESGQESSPNYLGIKTLETAEIPLPPYYSYLQELEKDFPSISALNVLDQSGNSFSVKEQTDALNTYAKLQYYQLFDLK